MRSSKNIVNRLIKELDLLLGICMSEFDGDLEEIDVIQRDVRRRQTFVAFSFNLLSVAREKVFQELWLRRL